MTMSTWRFSQAAILSTVCVFFISGLSVGSTVASDGISLTLSTLKDGNDHCGYLTCNHSSKADVTFFNELRIYNIANNGSKIASLSQGNHYVSAEGGFDLKRKYLRNSQASLQLSITKPENCLFGLYLCVVDFIDEHGSKQTNTAVVEAEDGGSVSCSNDRVVLKAEKSILDSLARIEQTILKDDKLLQEKMDRSQNTTNLIEMKMDEINTKYGHFSRVFEELDLLEDRTKEWTLAFRGTPFIDKAVYEAYIDGTGIPFDVEIGCKVITSSLPCYNHYRNSSILDHWKNIKEVKLAVYKNNVQVHYIIFNGQGSNYLNWFSQRRVLSSSWTDIKWKTTNYFSIEGLAIHGRRFYINHVFPGGCHLDIGWFSAFDSATNICPYHTSASYPLIKFVKGSEADVWQGPNFGVADFFAIFVK